jgi:hypothetical protein
MADGVRGPGEDGGAESLHGRAPAEFGWCP